MQLLLEYNSTAAGETVHAAELTKRLRENLLILAVVAITDRIDWCSRACCAYNHSHSTTAKTDFDFSVRSTQQ
jgi:hypothetical protein